MQQPKIRLDYFPVICQWAFTFGDNILTLHNAARWSATGYRFYPQRKWAIKAAEECGLYVTRSGYVHTQYFVVPKYTA